MRGDTTPHRASPHEGRAGIVASEPAAGTSFGPTIWWRHGAVAGRGRGVRGLVRRAYFATRIAMNDPADGPKRQAVTLACLRAVGVLPPE